MKLVFNLRHEMTLDNEFFLYETKGRIQEQIGYLWNSKVDKLKIEIDAAINKYLEELKKSHEN